MRFAELAVQLPVAGLYHYAIPERLRDRPLVGSRVLLPFGGRGVTGVVVRLTDDAPGGVEVREIEGLLDAEPQLSPELLELCLWIADYYEAPPGEVLRAALPAGTRVNAVQLVALTAAGRAALEGQGGALPPSAREVLVRLQAAGGAAPRKVLAVRKPLAIALAELVEAGLAEYALVPERQRVKARTVRTVRLATPLTDEVRATVARAPKRLAVLKAIAVHQAGAGSVPIATIETEVPHAATHVRALAKAGLVEIGEREVRAVAEVDTSGMTVATEPLALNALQQVALEAIQAGRAAGEFAPFLLHGVTGSGKTEVYLHAIAGAIAGGKSAIVLVPEISLTPQLAARFRARFGDRVAVLHSGLGDRERYDEWQRLRLGEARIALGARSAIFAPVADLGIVVVDEEHDSSFKQEEGVRYNARDVALVRAQRAGAVCVLGSATPSLESFHAADSGRYRLLSLPERATPRPLPSVEVIDLRVYQPESEAMLTAPMVTAIEETLERGEQVILFLNRRGFSTFVLCQSCGHAFRCDQCSVSLTYHKFRDRLVCHYCGFSRRVPEVCPSCSRPDSIARKGLGTEKVADAVAERFAGARVARLDRDVAGGAKAERVLARVGRREVDILVGTQMVTKGHDFPAVTLVGVLCADTGLSLPDFRAAERTFQLLTQVAGRAGRGDRAGRVLIQSYRTDSMAVIAAAEQSYQRFYADERAIRAELGYPPFGHLVAIRLDSQDGAAVAAAARTLARRAEALSARAGGGDPPVAVLGPSEAPLARLKGRTRWHVWLRSSDRRALRRFGRALLAGADLGGGVRLTVDVDPVSAL